MTIGVFFGGRNPEHDVSIITGELIISGLKKAGYDVVPVYLDKAGKWLLGEELGSLKFFKGDPAKRKDNGESKYYLDLEASYGKMVFKKKGLSSQTYSIDLAFPAFHGLNGEDGTIQGLFEILNVPYTGCGVAASAITMDKVLTKLLYERHNIPTTKFVYFSGNDWQNDKASILSKIDKALTWPLFVKPARLGSSIGIAKAADAKELEFAIEVALRYDDKVLVENGVQNLMDVTCAVLGNEEPKASLLQESVFEDALFSYEDKYLNDGGAQLGNAQNKIVIPARLDPAITEAIRSEALKVYKLLDCTGTARVDFLFNKETKEYYANEVNTLPGTLYHHLWKASGVELDALLKELVRCGLERHGSRQKLISVFESDLLNQAQSIKLQIDKKP